MRFKGSKKIASCLLCMMLIVATAFTTVGCNTKNNGGNNPPATKAEVSKDSVNTVLGEGKTKFLFTVVDKEGIKTDFEIHTDKETVGEALMDVGLIEGEEGEYGLYVKTVNGIIADYDIDQTYWAFYVNDEYALSGVEATPIEEGKIYCFKVEK